MIVCLLMLWLSEPVKNGLLPQSPVSMELVKELTLGQSDKDEELFSFGAIAVADSDHLFVLDPGNFRVVVFDQKGTFLYQFGRAGEGPGEFKEPMHFALTPAGEIAIFDAGHKRLMYFDKKGKINRSQTFNFGIQAIYNPNFLANGNIVATVRFTDENVQISDRLYVFDKDMKILKLLDKVDWGALDWESGNNPAFWVNFTKTQFEAFAKGQPLAALVGQDQFLGVQSAQYNGKIEGHLYDATGTELKKIHNTYKPVVFTDDAKDHIFGELWQDLNNNPGLSNFFQPGMFKKAMGQADIPATLPPIRQVFSVGTGFGLLMNYDPMKGKGRLDIFNKDGVFISTVPFKGVIKTLSGSGSTLLVSGEDEEGNILIEKYRLKGFPGTKS